MNITNKTVLISGGGSGIGFETAKFLLEKGNKVYILGRNEAKIKKAASELGDVTAIVCDITKESDVNQLVALVENEINDLSVLINNAAVAHVYKHEEKADSFEIAQEEMLTNYLSLIRLTEKLLPVLKSQPEAAVVNVSSVVAYLPHIIVPTYSDTKAAVHSYTRALRHALAKDTAVRVFELMPPLVNTESAKDIGGENGIQPREVAAGLFKGIENDDHEIYIGQTAQLRELYLSNPVDAFNVLNEGL